MLVLVLSGVMLMGMTADWDFGELLVPQILRGISLMMCMVPINNLALGTLPPERLKNASGLYNLTRNLGGAVGLVVINTTLANRGALHYERLAETVTWSNPAVKAKLEATSAALTAQGLDGPRGAMVSMIAEITRQATILSLIDIFNILALLFASLSLFVLLLKKPAPKGGPSAGH